MRVKKVLNKRDSSLSYRSQVSHSVLSIKNFLRSLQNLRSRVTLVFKGGLDEKVGGIQNEGSERGNTGTEHCSLSNILSIPVSRKVRGDSGPTVGFGCRLPVRCCMWGKVDGKQIKTTRKRSDVVGL